MVGFVNYELERIWKEMVVVYPRSFLGICLEGLRETTRNLILHS
jgi:hypothetical protein